MSMVLIETCVECRHEVVEHDSLGCRHGFEENGERFECVCHGYVA